MSIPDLLEWKSLDAIVSSVVRPILSSIIKQPDLDLDALTESVASLPEVPALNELVLCCAEACGPQGEACGH